MASAISSDGYVFTFPKRGSAIDSNGIFLFLHILEHILPIELAAALDVGVDGRRGKGSER